MTKFWKDLHQAICSTLKEEIPAIQTCEIYPAIRKELLAPAVFVELSGFEKGHDPGRLCCIASYDGLKIKKMENISSLLFWYL